MVFTNSWAEDWSPDHDDYDVIRKSSVGDIVTFADGKRYRIDKKTTTAAAVTRYYWWNKLLDKLFTRKDNDAVS